MRKNYACEIVKSETQLRVSDTTFVIHYTLITNKEFVLNKKQQTLQKLGHKNLFKKITRDHHNYLMHLLFQFLKS